MGIGPMVNAMCEKCNWSLNTHNIDVRKWGVELIVHMDRHQDHTIVIGICNV